MSRKAIYRDGFFKVSRRLLDSSLWCEDSDVLRVFLALVALSQDPGSPRNGTVFIARRQLAARCFMTEERLEECVRVLSHEDPQSRTGAHSGRRVEVLPNGFRVLNYSLYHDRDMDEKLSRDRSRAGRVGGRHSGETRRTQQHNSKQNRSKREANPKQNEATEREREIETERESIAPASAAPTALALKRPGGWVGEAMDIWPGVIAAGHVGKALSPVVKRYGADATLSGLGRWLEAGNAKFGPEVYARDAESWISGGGSRASPTPKEQKRRDVLEASILGGLKGDGTLGGDA
jgi:hypothetical protein